MAEDDTIFCWRVRHDVPGWTHLKDTRNGFGWFVDNGRYADDGTSWTPSTRGCRGGNGTASGHTPDQGRLKPKPTRAIDWNECLRQHGMNDRECSLLARILGVHPGTLRRLGIGWVPESEDEPAHWLCPERDGEGRVIGLLRRYGSGAKRRMAGASSGLTFEEADMDGNMNGKAIADTDTLLIVEGASDVAAAYTRGLRAVGRPNNMGGSEALATLIRQKLPEGVPVIVLGENDRRTQKDGTELWPGRDGAVHVAGQLARLTGRRIAWSMPPKGIKDLRDWFWWMLPDRNGETNVLDGRRCRRIGRSILAVIREGAQWIEAPRNVNLGNCEFQLCEIGHSNIHREGEEEGAGGGEGTTDDLAQLKFTIPQSPFAQWDSLPESVQDISAAGRTGRPCPRHFIPLLQGRGNPRVGLALRADCRRYDCPACGPRRLFRWLSHFLSIFELQASMYAAHIASEQFRALREYIRRNAGDYLAITQADGRILLIANGGFPSSRLVSPLEAADWTAKALQSLDARKKPIRTSRAWALPDYGEQSDYVRRGAAPKGRFPLVLERLRRSKLETFVDRAEHGARADWLFPAEWIPEQIEWLYEGLSLPPRAEEEERENHDS
jgi:hypothetical protein